MCVTDIEDLISQVSCPVGLLFSHLDAFPDLQQMNQLEITEQHLKSRPRWQQIEITLEENENQLKPPKQFQRLQFSAGAKAGHTAKKCPCCHATHYFMYTCMLSHSPTHTVSTVSY